LLRTDWQWLAGRVALFTRCYGDFTLLLSELCAVGVVFSLLNVEETTQVTE